MKPTPLDKIGLRWRDHKSALWWLGVLYRRPANFESASEDLTWLEHYKIILFLYCHALVYILLIWMLGRLTTLDWVEVSAQQLLSTSFEILQSHFSEIAIGCAIAIAVEFLGNTVLWIYCLVLKKVDTFIFAVALLLPQPQ